MLTSAEPREGAERVRPPATTRIRIEPDAAVRVVSDPFTAVLAVALRGVQDTGAGRATPAARLLRSLPAERQGALALLTAPRHSLIPDLLTPLHADRDVTVGAELERIRDLTADRIRTDIVDTCGGAPPQRWRTVLRAPRQWAAHTADALHDVWVLAEPAWRESAGRRDAEAARVGLAAVHGLLDTLAGDWHPRGRAEHGRLVFPDPEGVDVDAGGRRIVLAPFFAGLGLSVSNLDRPGTVRLAYPLSPRRPAADPDPDGLDALLTPLRTLILQSLDGPQSMTALARAARISPGNATYQIDFLTRTGLTRRDREGRRTIVSRTVRGDRLLAIYGLRKIDEIG